MKRMTPAQIDLDWKITRINGMAKDKNQMLSCRSNIIAPELIVLMSAVTGAVDSIKTYHLH